MNIAALTINVVAGVALLYAALTDWEKTKRALVSALKSFLAMVPMVITVIIVIGVLLGFVTPELIGRIVGEESGIAGTLIAVVFGGIMHIPAVISFPLAASLIEGGAAAGAVAGLIASLTMIGTVTLPLELKQLGVKMTVLRNGLGFLFAIGIAVVMGAIL